MKLPRRQFLHLAAGAAVLPACHRDRQAAPVVDDKEKWAKVIRAANIKAE